VIEKISKYRQKEAFQFEEIEPYIGLVQTHMA